MHFLSIYSHLNFSSSGLGNSLGQGFGLGTSPSQGLGGGVGLGLGLGLGVGSGVGVSGSGSLGTGGGVGGSVGVGLGGGLGGTGGVGLGGSGSLVANPLKPIHVIHTPTAVGRISWRPASLSDTRVQRNQLQLATSSPDRGEISVWDVNMPNIPICILKGHSNEACTGISWLDTPLHTTSSTTSPTSSSNSSASNIKSESVEIKSNFLSRKQTPSPPIPKIIPGSGPGSGPGSALNSTNSTTEWMDVYQHILSTGKDGKLYVQDVRNGMFPRQHIARAMAAISSRGHVAYQRGEVSRVRFVVIHFLVTASLLFYFIFVVLFFILLFFILFLFFFF